MTTAQLALLEVRDCTGPRTWDRANQVPQDELGLHIRDRDGLTARNVEPGRWWWVNADGTELDPKRWAPSKPWHWPAYLRFPVTEVIGMQPGKDRP